MTSTGRLPASALLVALLACGTGGHHAPAASTAPGTESIAREASGPPASHALLVAPDEPGEPLEVHGTVFEPDGTTPAAGVVVYVYHTGADGRYSRERDAPPRLRAWIVTDAQGRYSYRTIRPAPYPGGTIPAHVHTQLWSARFPPQYGTDLEFDDDPHVTALEIAASNRLGRFAWVATPSRDERGAWRATHDLRLKSSGDEFEDNTRHGLRDCPADLLPDGE
jgi:protocatechuate 3,4-dioxygenase beta subunit